MKLEARVGTVGNLLVCVVATRGRGAPSATAHPAFIFHPEYTESQTLSLQTNHMPSFFVTQLLPSQTTSPPCVHTIPAIHTLHSLWALTAGL
jgi:hypothetical protein